MLADGGRSCLFKLAPYPQWRLNLKLAAYVPSFESSHTIDTSIIWLDMDLLDLAVLYEQRIAFRAWLAENLGRVKGQVQSIRELCQWIT